MPEPFGPVVSPEWLRAHLGDEHLRVVDFRWYLDGRSGAEAYASGHLPGAVFIDLGAVSGATGPGRHPLPTGEQFQTAMRAAGVGRRTRIVVYDDACGSVAGRLWFLLRWFGHPAVAVLDGGIQAWGEPLETAAGDAEPGDFVAAEPDPSWNLTWQEVLDRPPGTVLVDARAPERYRGEVEPVDPRAGHIPGALNAHWKENLGSDGRYLSPEKLREMYVARGIERGDEAIVYCGSGVSAVHDLIALELAGLDGARLYAGSWSDWSSHDDLPVATGAQ